MGKSYILTVKNNDNWTFLIFFAFTIVFSLELKTRLYYLSNTITTDTSPHLHRWAVARHKLCNSPTRKRHYKGLRTKIDIDSPLGFMSNITHMVMSNIHLHTKKN